MSSRRAFLLLSEAGLLAVASVSCGLFETEPERADGGAADEQGSADAMEAPALAARVEAGDLPALKERLPEAPLVVEPVEQVGRYGGEWNTAALGPADTAWLYRTIGYDASLMRWDAEFVEPIANLAESIDVIDDGVEYVIHIREGVKWSDGEPFTVDDILFAYDDVVSNRELYPAPPDWLVIDGTAARMEKEGDFSVRVTFDAISGLFREYLATPEADWIATMPRHYLEQFHVDYNPDVAELVGQEGFDDWAQLFLAKADSWEHVGKPTLGAWQVTRALGEGERVVAERNPYYWKTDPDGRQLPYLDQVVFDVVADEEVLLLKAMSGELDMHTRHITVPANKPALAAEREQGNFRFLEMINANSSLFCVAFNLTHDDPVKREVFSNRDFRVGLSHAINRDEVIAVAYQGEGEPLQVAPLRQSVFYDEELATQFTEFDVDLANQYLDDAGYSERDGDDFRLGPSGERISFDVDVPLGWDPAWIDSMQLISDYWGAVGIEARVNTIDRALYEERRTANSHDAMVQNGSGGLNDILFQPQWFFPTGNGAPGYAVPWANWYTDGPDPKEEPPEATRRQMELFDEVLTTADDAERRALMMELLAIAKEEFYTIGIVSPAGSYGIVKNSFHNVVEPMVDSWMYPNPGPALVEQYFEDA